MTVRQLILDLPKREPDYRREKFLLSDANSAALAAGERWLASEEPCLCICGPAHSGKTHLSRLLVETAGALILPAGDFTGSDTSAPMIIVENMPPQNPKGFLLRLEDLINSGARIIMTGRGAPADWSGGLTDLKTRLEAMPRASLNAPDEPLIEAIMKREFARRQISVDPATIAFCIARLPLSFEAAFRFVEAADQRALEEKRAVTKPLAKKILDEASCSA